MPSVKNCMFQFLCNITGSIFTPLGFTLITKEDFTSVIMDIVVVEMEKDSSKVQTDPFNCDHFLKNSKDHYLN